MKPLWPNLYDRVKDRRYGTLFMFEERRTFTFFPLLHQAIETCVQAHISSRRTTWFNVTVLSRASSSATPSRQRRCPG